MDQKSWFVGSEFRPRAGTGHARARRLLLEQVRMAITGEPATLDSVPELPAESVTKIRGRVSIMVGTIVVRLNREGFTQSDRLYVIRDVLAEGRPVMDDDIEWLNGMIAVEAGQSTALGGPPAH